MNRFNSLWREWDLTMTDNKSVAKKRAAKWKKAVQAAKKRLPSERSKDRCKGCFSPRNTLTVKGNLEHVWNKAQIVLLPRTEERKGINVPCGECGNIRYLSLGSYGRDVLEADLDQFDNFILLKDSKWNALIGIEPPKEDKTLDLTEIDK